MQEMFLDTPSLAYRAFYSVPNTIKDPAGRPVNAVRGVMDMIATLKEERGPERIIAIGDADWRPAFRVAAYEGYKADRPEEPPELTYQFALLNEVLDAAGVPRAEADGYEADDVIATLSASVTGDDRASIVTGDRDLLCLVRDPYVSLLFTVKGVRELKRFDERAVQEAYGVTPQSYCEFAMLRGDPSDGLPGVPGVGPKTAVQLLERHGSISGIYENLDDLSPRQQKAFEGSRDYLHLMERVVPPVTDVAVDMTDGSDADAEALKRSAEQHNLEGPARRIWGALYGDRS